MPTIDTKPISEAHDKIFNKAIDGLGSARTTLLEWSEKIEEKTGSVSALEKLPPADEVINKGFDLVEKGLTKQHDFVEGLLAKGRGEEEAEATVTVVEDVVVAEAPVPAPASAE